MQADVDIPREEHVEIQYSCYPPRNPRDIRHMYDIGEIVINEFRKGREVSLIFNSKKDVTEFLARDGFSSRAAILSIYLDQNGFGHCLYFTGNGMKMVYSPIVNNEKYNYSFS